MTLEELRDIKEYNAVEKTQREEIVKLTGISMDIVTLYEMTLLTTESGRKHISMRGKDTWSVSWILLDDDTIIKDLKDGLYVISRPYGDSITINKSRHFTVNIY